MEGWNGGRGSSWSYRQESIGSNVSSSRSGTIVSSAYTSSIASRLSSVSTHIEAAMHFDSLGIHEEEEHDDNNVDGHDDDNVNGHDDDNVDGHDDDNVDGHDGESRPWGWWWEKAADQCKVRITSLVQEFSIEQSANCSMKVGDISVVERWLAELGVGWVLSLDHVASAEEELDRDLRRWIQALDEIAQTMCFMKQIFPAATSSMELPSIGEEGEEHVVETSSPERYHLLLFIQEAMLKILTFVDFTVALAMAPLYSRIIDLLVLHDALSRASNKVISQFGGPTSAEVQTIEDEMTILLSTNKSKVGEAIWSKMENIRTKSLGDGDDSLSSLDPQGSSDIHKATVSIVTYIKFLRSNYRSVNAAISDKYMCDIVNIQPLDSMISEMVSCLEEKLANISKSFPDQGLRFLFLLNNLYNIMQYVDDQKCFDLVDKIENHIERYVEVSWGLLLSCLLNPMPLFLGKIYSPLTKVESIFHKIYTTQKQWKVPDPWLRRRLRMSISDKIIPAYTEYLENNKVTTPKITPEELDEMLQEMFEG